MPDREITLLPYKSRKVDIYNCYSEEMTEKWRVSVAKASFYKMWKENFKNLKIKKTNSFSRCETCTTFTRRLEETRDRVMREEIKTNLLAHNNRQMAERAYYRAKRKTAEENKRHYLSLIIDGMDQAKTNLPHFTGRKSKGLDCANLLSTHVQGVINHGLNRFTTFVDINEYSHDPNLVMNTLLRELYDTSKLMGNFLPEILYLQADNCFRENKNRYVLSFCELLVRKNIFKEVHMSFLIVGHTHEDIDAEFSKVSEKLRKRDAETLVQLMDLLPLSKQTGGLYDVKGWLEEHITPISGQSGPLHFKFSRDEADNVIGQYKGLSHRPWKKLSKMMLKSMPKGIPKILVPNFKNHKFDLLLKNINKCKYLFSDIVRDTQFRWWQRYISYLDDVSKCKAKSVIYGKTNAKWLLPLLPKRSIQPTPHDVNLPAEIQEMIDKEADDPTIRMQSPKKKNKNKPSIKAKGGKTQKKKSQKKSTQRSILSTYVYGYICQKKQRYFCIITTLIELLLFLNFCYLTLCVRSILELLLLLRLYIQSHIVTRAGINISVVHNSEFFSKEMVCF